MKKLVFLPQSIGAHGPFLMLAAVLIAVSVLAGCDLFGKDEEKRYDYVFTNASYYAVTVQPDGQTSWSSFTMTAGTVKTVSIPETTIRFKYNQATLILCDNSVLGKLRFYNRTMLMIRNSTTVDLDFVEWRGYYFGEDLVWDTAMGKYVYGLKPYSEYLNEVSPGSAYIYFWFAAGGPRYRTTTLVSLAKEEQKTFTFLGTTTVVTASLRPGNPASTGPYPAEAGTEGDSESFVLGIEVVPGTGDEDRRREDAATSVEAPVGNGEAARIPGTAGRDGRGDDTAFAEARGIAGETTTPD